MAFDPVKWLMRSLGYVAVADVLAIEHNFVERADALRRENEDLQSQIAGFAQSISDIRFQIDQQKLLTSGSTVAMLQQQIKRQNAVIAGFAKQLAAAPVKDPKTGKFMSRAKLLALTHEATKAEDAPHAE